MSFATNVEPNHKLRRRERQGRGEGESRGEKGAVSVNGNEITECGIKKNLKIVDLTGAGDLFAAGFLHGHVNNMSQKECLEKGTEMSSKVIQQIGARI